MKAVSRRRFLQVGLAGAAVLALGRWLHEPPAAHAASHAFLDATTAPMVAALAAAVLEGSLPAKGEARTRALHEVVDAFDRAVAGLSPRVRDEVGQLLAVLRFAPTRLALTGLWQPIEAAPAAEVAGFLAAWRTSRFDLQRAGYQALTQLLQAAWYANAASWPAIGYPGPPRVNA